MAAVKTKEQKRMPHRRRSPYFDGYRSVWPGEDGVGTGSGRWLGLLTDCLDLGVAGGVARVSGGWDFSVFRNSNRPLRCPSLLLLL